MGWVEWISANILKTVRVYWRAPVLLNFVRCPRFEPSTTGLSGKIHTHLTTVLSMWFIGSFYGIYSNGDDRWKAYQIRAWSNYAWSLFCHRFVDIQQSFSWYFCIKHGNSAELRWTKTQSYAISWYNSLFHSLRRRRSTLVLTGTTIPWLYVIIMARPHQNCTKCVFSLAGAEYLIRHVFFFLRCRKLALLRRWLVASRQSWGADWFARAPFRSRALAMSLFNVN